MKKPYRADVDLFPELGQGSDAGAGVDLFPELNAKPAAAAPAATGVDEPAFQSWYKERAAKTGINPNPDDPQHFYDYRAAFKAGAEPGADGHWPSEFKKEGHPRLVLDGVDTRTGKPVGVNQKGVDPVEDPVADFLREGARAVLPPGTKDIVDAPGAGRTLKNIGVASAGMVEGTAAAYRAAERFAGQDTPVGRGAQKVADVARTAGRQAQPANPNFGDAMVQGATSMGMFFVPGLGVAKGAGALAKVAPIAAKLAPLLGQATMTVLESMQEAGLVFQDIREKGGQPGEFGEALGDAQASDAAAKTFGSNMALIGVTNFLSGYLKVSKRAALEILKAAGSEGIQEGGQEIISSLAKGEPVNWEAVMTSMGVGALLGGGTSALEGAASPEDVPRGTEVPPAEQGRQPDLGTGGMPPPGAPDFVVDPDGNIRPTAKVNPQAEEYLGQRFPVLVEPAKVAATGLPQEVLDMALFEGATAGEEVLLRGGTPEEANLAAAQAFEKAAKAPAAAPTEGQPDPALSRQVEEISPEALGRVSPEQMAAAEAAEVVAEKPARITRGEVQAAADELIRSGDLPIDATPEQAQAAAQKDLQFQAMDKAGDTLAPEFHEAHATQTVERARADIGKEVTRLAKLNAVDQGLAVKVVDYILADEAALKSGYGEGATPGNMRILGEYRPGALERVIKLSKAAKIETEAHEFFHDAVRMVLSPEERAVIQKAYKDEEKAADAFGRYVKGQRTKSAVHQLFERAWNFIQKLADSFRQLNLDSPEKIFEALNSGRLASRTKSLLARAQKKGQNGSYERHKESQANQRRRGRGDQPGPLPSEVRADEAPLEGLPPTQPGPNLDVRRAAQEYAAAAGLTYRQQNTYVRVDPARAARIAQAFEEMKHAPQDPDVKAAYDALIEETLAQFQQVKKLGIKLERITPDMENPYADGPKMVHDDVRKGHLWFFPSESGFGTINNVADNPLLAETEEMVDGQKLLANDVFRIVHDIFGHVKEGVGFGPNGEENAFQSHVRMYTDLAAKAMASETRGQNSWLNFGPHGEANRLNQVQAPEKIIYADQKVGILPDWVMTEGVEPDRKYSAERKLTSAFKKWFGDSKIVDSTGKPMVVYHGTRRDFTEFKSVSYRTPQFWFTNQPDFASIYAMEGATVPRNVEDVSGANIKPLFVSVQKPLVVKTPAEAATLPRDAELQRQGYDGVLFHHDDGHVTGYVMRAEQIKSATGNRGTFDPKNPDIRYSAEPAKPAPVFFSQLGKLIEAKMGDKAPPAQVAGMIKNGGLKQEEIENTGILDFLAAWPDKTITKGDVLDHIDEFKIELKETLLGDDGVKKDSPKVLERAEELRSDAADEAMEDFYPELDDGFKIDAIPRDDENAAMGAGKPDLWGKGIKPHEPYRRLIIAGEPVMFDDIPERLHEHAFEGEDGVAIFKNYDTANDLFYELSQPYADDIRDEAYREWMNEHDVDEFLEEARSELGVEAEEIETDDGQPLDGHTGYHNYQLEGEKKKYRELLFHLPAQAEPVYTKGNIKKIDPRGGQSNEFWYFWSPVKKIEWSVPKTKFPTAELALDYIIKNKQPEGEAKFTAPHFGNVSRDYAKNLLMHVRFNDRIDKDGKKVLFIEEIQSDWHQEGREQGYKKPDPPELAALEEQLAGFNHLINERYDEIHNTEGYRGEFNESDIRSFSAFLRTKDAEYDRLSREAEAIREKLVAMKGPEGAVPDAPFKKNWQEIALKRMIRWAAENGYDRLAWTQGKHQIDRYTQAIRQNVDKIAWDRVNDKLEPRTDGKVRIVAFKNKNEAFNQDVPLEGKMSYHGYNFTLDQIVGKTLAKQIRESTENAGTFEGDGLAIGGEGMKGFYDQMLPQFLNKYAKKWGATVGETGIRQAGRTEFVPIPREKVTWEVLARAAELSANATDSSVPAALKSFASVVKKTGHFAEDEGFLLDPGHTLGQWVAAALNHRPVEKVKSEAVHSMDITPEMRNAVIVEGQPLYMAEPIDPEGARPATPQWIYRANRENTPLAVDAKEAIKKILHDSRVFADEAAGVLSTRFKNINSKLKVALRTFEFNTRQRIKEDLEAAEDMLRRSAGMTPSDRADFDLARKNGDVEVVHGLSRKYNINIFQVRAMLNGIHQRARDVGFEVGYLQHYHPRVIKDVKGFLEYMMGSKLRPMLMEAILQKESEIERVLTDEEKANFINQLLRGFNRSKLSLSKTGNMKEREIEQLTAHMNRFYHSSDQALMIYIHQVNEAVEARRFFGKKAKPSKLEFHDPVESIGAYVYDLLEKGEIEPGQDIELRDMLVARFSYKGTTGLIGLYKNLSYLTTIASPISAISNLEDIGYVLFKAPLHTPGSFIRAAMDKSKITMADLGLDTIAEELRESTRTAGALRKFLSATGFTKLDRVAKEATINAIVDKYRAQAKNPTVDFLKRLRAIFGEEVGPVLKDLQEGKKLTENILFLAFNEISDVQPITLSEVPQKYLENPNGRIFYVLKTFMIKRLDVWRNEVVHGLQEPGVAAKAAAIKRFLHLYALLVICGIGVDELKDLVLNRYTKWSDRLIDNLIKPFGLSKFFLYRARSEGLAKSSLMFILPPTSLFDSIQKDVRTMGDEKGLESTAQIPIVGKLYYWLWGKGADKSKKAKLRANYQPGGAKGIVKKAGLAAGGVKRSTMTSGGLK